MHVRLVLGALARLPTLWTHGGRRLEVQGSDVTG
jgi:hypothetical protein